MQSGNTACEMWKIVIFFKMFDYACGFQTAYGKILKFNYFLGIWKTRFWIISKKKFHQQILTWPYFQ